MQDDFRKSVERIREATDGIRREFAKYEDDQPVIVQVGQIVKLIDAYDGIMEACLILAKE